MRKIKCAVGIVVGFVIFYGIVTVLNFLYILESDSQTERALWNGYYQSEGKISHLYLGSSHVYCDINPFLLDERNGQYNFDMATPGQLMNGTYYLLKEADKNNELSHVYVELYYYFNVKEYFNQYEEPIKTNAFRNWTILDHMKFSWNKLIYMGMTTQTEQYPDVLLGFVRYRSKIDDWGYAGENAIQKMGHDDKEKVENTRGYASRDTVYQERERLYQQSCILEENPMAKSSENYLRKAITYCQQRQIPVTLFVSPTYELQLISTEGYDNYVDQVREIAEEYQVDFYDFNLAKEEYLPIQKTEYFGDIGHLNTKGADLFTDFFWQVVSGTVSDNTGYFYDSYGQKLQNQEPAVYGIYYRASEDSEKNMWVASNREAEMEYKITCTTSEGERHTIQDFHENKVFKVPAWEQGTCEITCRLKNMPNSEQTVEIVY